jgi:FkbM family methyltransferase
MENPQPSPRTWQETLAATARPWRDRLVHALGGSVGNGAPGPEAPERSIAYEQLVAMLYPELPESQRAVLDQAATGSLADVSTIRRMLGAVEHQLAPTRFSVQLAEADALRCQVGDVELFCDVADAAVTPGLRSGRYEPHLSAAFERYCTPGMTVLDVGANVGYFALLASGLVGPGGRVLAFEPNSENCRLLLSSVRLQGADNVELLPVAAGESTGWAYYSTHVGSNGGLVERGDLLAHPGVVVPTFALDDLVSGEVGFIKMDVEGAEGRVVRGAARLIEQHRPVVTTELKGEMLRRVSGLSVAEYLGAFERLGYTAGVLEKETCEEQRYPSMAALVAEIEENDELRDVVLLPTAR